LEREAKVGKTPNQKKGGYEKDRMWKAGSVDKRQARLGGSEEKRSGGEQRKPQKEKANLKGRNGIKPIQGKSKSGKFDLHSKEATMRILGHAGPQPKKTPGKVQPHWKGKKPKELEEKLSKIFAGKSIHGGPVEQVRTPSVQELSNKGGAKASQRDHPTREDLVNNLSTEKR